MLLRSLIFDFLMYSSMLVMGIAFAPAAIWSQDGAYWACKTYCRWVLWLLRVICGLRTEVRGSVPEGNVIVCAKHQSFLDILLLMHALPRMKAIMKKELKWAPIFGFYATRVGSTPVAEFIYSTGTAAGLGAFRMQPSGAETVKGSSDPALLGMREETAQQIRKQV